MIQVKPRTKRILFTTLKIAVALFFVFWIVDYWNSELKDSKTLLYQVNTSYLFIAILLFTLNWFTEARKWQVLIKKTEKISLFKSLISVFSGATASAFIPYRMGNFLGRMIHLNTAFKARAIPASIIGNLMQLSVTLLIGTVSFMYWVADGNKGISPDNPKTYILILSVCLFLFFLAFIKYKSIAKFLNTLFKKFYRRKERRLLSYYPAKTLVHTWGLSFLRYLIFTTQYVVILKAFGIQGSFFIMAILISTAYLYQSFVPSIFLLDIGIKTGIAFTLFTDYFKDIEASLMIALVLHYLLNTVIPVFIGSIGILTIKFRPK